MHQRTTWFGIGVRKLKSQTGNREFGTANAVSRAVTEAPPCPPAASRAGDATGLRPGAVAGARAPCAPRDGRLPACARDVCVAGRAPAAESALRGNSAGRSGST